MKRFALIGLFFLASCGTGTSGPIPDIMGTYVAGAGNNCPFAFPIIITQDGSNFTAFTDDGEELDGVIDSAGDVEMTNNDTLCEGVAEGTSIETDCVTDDEGCTAIWEQA